MGWIAVSMADPVSLRYFLQTGMKNVSFNDFIPPTLKTAVFGGCELADQAIQLRPKLRVLYTTGNSLTEKLKALFVEGAHYLRKPYTHHQLQASVEDLLAA